LPILDFLNDLCSSDGAGRAEKKLTSQHTSQSSSSQDKIDDDTSSQLKDLEAAVKSNQGGVVKNIVERVMQCEPEMHRNLRKVEA
jgi:V-type H+-transporting ATPase subunit G